MFYITILFITATAVSSYKLTGLLVQFRVTS